jgi:hypothetical protein
MVAAPFIDPYDACVEMVASGCPPPRADNHFAIVGI